MKVRAFEKTDNNTGKEYTYTSFNIVKYCCRKVKDYVKDFEPKEVTTTSNDGVVVILSFSDPSKIPIIRIRYCPFCGTPVRFLTQKQRKNEFF